MIIRSISRLHGCSRSTLSKADRNCDAQGGASSFGWDHEPRHIHFPQRTPRRDQPPNFQRCFTQRGDPVSIWQISTTLWLCRTLRVAINKHVSRRIFRRRKRWDFYRGFLYPLHTIHRPIGLLAFHCMETEHRLTRGVVEVKFQLSRMIGYWLHSLWDGSSV